MKFRTSKTADIAYFGLCFSIYVSLNSITAKYFGVTQIASPLILLCCLTIISIIGITKSSFNSFAIKLLYGVFISYYFIGLTTRLFLVDVVYRVTIYDQLMKFITSMIIILCVHQYLYRRLLIERKESVVFNGLYIPIIISNIYSIYQSLTGQLISQHGYAERALGVFANPNELGALANIGLIFTFYSLYSHKRFFYWKLILIPTLLYVSFLSLSRSSMITSAAVLVVSVGWMLFKYYKLNKSTRLRAFFIIGLPISLVTYITMNFEYLILKHLDYWQAKKIITIIDLVFKGKISNETTSGRTEVVEFGIEMIKQRPFFGNGLGYFQYFPAELGFNHGVHNTYLLILGDSGIIAFIFLMSMLLYVLVRSYFIKPLSGLLAFGCMMIWAMQNLSGHNGLDDKMSNILITCSILYLIFGMNMNKVKITK